MDQVKLEHSFLYSICSGGNTLPDHEANKVQSQIYKALELLGNDQHPHTPFALINLMHTEKGVSEALKAVKFRLSEAKATAICQVAGLWVMDMLDLNTVTVKQLEMVKSIGPKPARHFVLSTRKNQPYVLLDDAVLKHLAANGVKVPTAVPGKGDTYDRLEKEVVKLANLSGLNVSEYLDGVMSSKK